MLKSVKVKEDSNHQRAGQAGRALQEFDSASADPVPVQFDSDNAQESVPASDLVTLGNV